MSKKRGKEKVWAHFNCKTVEREVEDKYDEKKKRMVREITTKTVCDLKPVNLPATNLTRGLLEQVIQEVIAEYKQSLNHRKISPYDFD